MQDQRTAKRPHGLKRYEQGWGWREAVENEAEKVDGDKHVGCNKDTSFILNTLRSHLRIMRKRCFNYVYKDNFCYWGKDVG